MGSTTQMESLAYRSRFRHDVLWLSLKVRPDPVATARGSDPLATPTSRGSVPVTRFTGLRLIIADVFQDNRPGSNRQATCLLDADGETRFRAILKVISQQGSIAFAHLGNRGSYKPAGPTPVAGSFPLNDRDHGGNGSYREIHSNKE